MPHISKMGWTYLAYGLAMCAFFCTAAIGKWQGPDFGSGAGYTAGRSSYYGHSSSGWSSGRTSGGFWGGGK